MKLVLSGRQLSMLEMFTSQPAGEYMTIEQAQQWDQRPFRSMLMRRWITYKTGKGFHVTREGREALRRFNNAEIARKNASLPLTVYFDATAYGLKPAPAAKVRMINAA